MYAQVEKPKENKSRAVANAVGQKKLNPTQGFYFKDNRNKNVLQCKWKKVNSMKQTVNDRVCQFAPAKFKPTFPEPNPLVDGRRYWNNSPNGFTRGDLYWNSNNSKYKKTKDGKEIHATIDSMSTADKAEKLRDFVKLHPSWISRDQERVGNRIDLSSWTPTRHYINKWHISIKDGNDNVGGWFEIIGQAALPAYTNNGHAATLNQSGAATQIHTNMNNNTL